MKKSGKENFGGTNFCPGAVRPGIVLKYFVQDKFFLLLNMPQKLSIQAISSHKQKTRGHFQDKKFLWKKVKFIPREFQVFFLSPDNPRTDKSRTKKPRRPENFS